MGRKGPTAKGFLLYREPTYRKDQTYPSFIQPVSQSCVGGHPLQDTRCLFPTRVLIHGYAQDEFDISGSPQAPAAVLGSSSLSKQAT